MLDHLIIRATDPVAMAAYYERVLATVGYHKGAEYPGGTQFVDDETGDAVWISAAKEGTAPTPSHYAWRAKTIDDVQAFYDAALDGGTDNGAPGPRDYHSGYYACFVLDPEGNNIEAVLHDYTAD